MSGLAAAARRLAPAGGRRLAESLAPGAAMILALAVVLPRASALGAEIAKRAVRPDPGPWEAWFTYLALGGVAIAAALAGAGAVRAAARFAPRWAWVLGPGLALAAGGAALRLSATLGAVALVLALGVGSLFARARRQGAAGGRADAAIAAASLGACAGLGAWLPLSIRYGGLAWILMGVGAVLAGVLAASRKAVDDAWLVVLTLAPSALLPFVGLRRGPTLGWLVATILAGIGLAIAARVRPGFGRRALDTCKMHAFTVGAPLAAALLFVPYRFRDIPSSDLHGHEAQHLGWINSISFGKLTMADAGFIYGPLREYVLYTGARAVGGLDLANVRVMHVVANMVGAILVFAAARRVAPRRAFVALAVLALALFHTPLVAMMNYLQTYSFGWADAARAGLPCFGAALALTAPAEEPRRGRFVFLGGLLVATGALYSHDFGIVGIASTGGALLSGVLVRGAALRARARGTLRDALAFGLGVGAVLGLFTLVYAAKGRAGLLLQGLHWVAQVASGKAGFAYQKYPISDMTWARWDALTSPIQVETKVGASPLDFIVGPALPVLGFALAGVDLVRGRFGDRSRLLLGLSAFAFLTQRHPFLTADAWHMANATTPGLVLFAYLADRGAGSALSIGRRAIPLGAIAAVAFAAFWLDHGAEVPLGTRLARVGAGDERPSFGGPYRYPTLPRAGDMMIPEADVRLAEFIRANSRPDEPVFCTTWFLGGGKECFLAERRNPTSFDVPHEVLPGNPQALVARQLRADPPALIVGNYFDLVGPDAARFLQQGWEGAPGAPSTVLRRKR